MKKVALTIVLGVLVFQSFLILPIFKDWYLNYQANSLLRAEIQDLEIEYMKFSLPQKNNINYLSYKYCTMGASSVEDTIYIVSKISPLLFVPNNVWAFEKKDLNSNTKVKNEIANLKFGQIEQ